MVLSYVTMLVHYVIHWIASATVSCTTEHVKKHDKHDTQLHRAIPKKGPDYNAPREETNNHTFEVFVISLSQGIW